MNETLTTAAAVITPVAAEPTDAEKAEAFIRREAERNLEYRLKTMREVAETADKLRAAGFEVNVCLEYAYRVTLHLGDMSGKKAERDEVARKLNLVRRVFGARLVENEKEPYGDGKKHLVKVFMQPHGNDKVRVSFVRKLPRGSKCRIVTQKTSYRTVVCDL
jgi:hypothetical protein